MNPPTLRPAETGVLVVDWQARLCAAMPDAVVEQNTRHAANILQLAATLALPVVATEQYPKGLGPTVEAIAAHLPDPAHAKTMFSALADPAAGAAIRAAGRRTWIVVGMEAHICVFQTARDLVAAGFAVHVPRDAVVSRTKGNWHNGLELARRAGAVVTNSETALFDLLGEGRGEAFKMVSRLIR